MTARILVVDDTPANVRLLEARLSAEYYGVMTALSGPEALAICGREPCDLVLLDLMMPGMDGFETCRRLKADPATAHIPVIMLTALDGTADRVKGLESGADDFLSKPFDDLQLLARVKSLTRLKIMLDEIRCRIAIPRAAVGGPEASVPVPLENNGLGGRILVAEDRPGTIDRVTLTLGALHEVQVEQDPQRALFRGVEGDFDLFVISLGFRDFDALRLCGQLRSLERTRHLPILLVAGPEDQRRVLRGFDIGVNDYLSRPIDANELLARVRTQIRWKRYSDRLQGLLQTSIEMALVDSLTGLHNRRYLDNTLTPLVQSAAGRGRPFSLMLLDLDHFKAVNDTHGHDVGDDVLRIFAGRLKHVVRAGDIVCRMGGEEFIVVLPDTPITAASGIAERIRSAIGESLFEIGGGDLRIPVTVSIGLADRGRDSEASPLLKRADLALYEAKRAGRDRVTALAA